jgi:hypothetical protein
MNDRDAKIGEMRQWAVEILQQVLPRGQTRSTEGKTMLSRKLLELLSTCHEIGAAPPEELIAVFARQLDVGGRIRNAPRLKIEQMMAAMALAHEPTISDKKLAALCGVSRPTVARWKNEPWFERLKTIFELDGVLKEVFPWQQKLSR